MAAAIYVLRYYLANSYECDQLVRVVDCVLRSLRLGTALTGTHEETAEQEHAGHRAMLEERVAKAPVKMTLPTDALILPTMLFWKSIMNNT